MGKVFLGFIMAAVFAVSIISVSLVYADGEWKDLISATQQIKDDTLKLTATAVGKIPKNDKIFDSTVGRKIAAGHAWMDIDDDNGDGKIEGIFTNVHPTLAKDAKKKQDKTHLHLIMPTPSPVVTKPWNYCIVLSEMGEVLGGIGLNKKTNTLKVKIPMHRVPFDPDILDTATSYTIWDPLVTTDQCPPGNHLLKLNGLLRGTEVPITSP